MMRISRRASRFGASNCFRRVDLQGDKALVISSVSATGRYRRKSLRSALILGVALPFQKLSIKFFNILVRQFGASVLRDEIPKARQRR